MSSLRTPGKNSLVANVFSLVVLQGFNYLLPLLTVPFLFRVLGSEGYGLVNFATAFAAYFVVIADYGFCLSATQKIASHRENKIAVQEIYSAVTWARITLLVLCAFVYALIVWLHGDFRRDWVLYLFNFGIVVGNIMFPTWFFHGMETMRFITIINISSKILAIVPLFFVVRSTGDYFLVPAFHAAGFLLAGIASIFIIRNRFGLKLGMVNKTAVFITLREGWGFFLSRIAVSLYTVSNTFAMGLTSGLQATGIYSAAEKTYLAINAALLPLSQALFPYMSKNRNLRLFIKIFGGFLIFYVLLIALLAWQAEKIVYLLFSTAGQDVVLVFRILLVGSILAGPSNLLGYPLLAAMGHARFVNWSLTLVAALHLAILAVLSFMGQVSPTRVAWLVVFSEASLLLWRVGGIVHFRIWRQTLIPYENQQTTT